MEKYQIVYDSITKIVQIITCEFRVSQIQDKHTGKTPTEIP